MTPELVSCARGGMTRYLRSIQQPNCWRTGQRVVVLVQWVPAVGVDFVGVISRRTVEV